MTKKQLENIIAGNAYLEYCGNLYEHSFTEQIATDSGVVLEKREHFSDVNNGHDINFRANTILTSSHFQYTPFERVSRGGHHV